MWWWRCRPGLIRWQDLAVTAGSDSALSCGGNLDRSLFRRGGQDNAGSIKNRLDCRIQDFCNCRCLAAGWSSAALAQYGGPCRTSSKCVRRVISTPSVGGAASASRPRRRGIRVPARRDMCTTSATATRPTKSNDCSPRSSGQWCHDIARATSPPPATL